MALCLILKKQIFFYFSFVSISHFLQKTIIHLGSLIVVVSCTKNDAYELAWKCDISFVFKENEKNTWYQSNAEYVC